jgi:hypothetical protein
VIVGGKSRLLLVMNRSAPMPTAVARWVASAALSRYRLDSRTVADDLAIPVIDLYLHTWDLGVAVGIAVETPADVIDFAHADIDPLPDEMLGGADRAFGQQIRVPASATPTERFIAWTRCRAAVA